MLRAGSSRREVVVAAAEQSLLSRALEPIKALLGRGAVYGSFFVAKQPARIRQARPTRCVGLMWQSSSHSPGPPSGLYGSFHLAQWPMLIRQACAGLHMPTPRACSVYLDRHVSCHIPMKVKASRQD